MNKLITACFLSLLTTIATADPAATERTTYYKINGTTADQLRAQMNMQGPLDHDKQVDGKTSWYVKWSYQWRYDSPSQNPCYVTSVKVTADVTYLVPEWVNQNQGTPELQTKWNNFSKSLLAHEQDHGKNGKLAATEIEKALKGIQPQSSCKALQDKLEGAAKKILSDHNAWDTKYDIDTDHGKKQGANFP